jgi:hypothetical protein
MQSVQTIEMPRKAKVLTVQLQFNQPWMWAMVDSDNDKEVREFELRGTGENLPVLVATYRKYINTIQFDNGLVYHLFELTKETFNRGHR